MLSMLSSIGGLFNLLLLIVAILLWVLRMGKVKSYLQFVETNNGFVSIFGTVSLIFIICLVALFFQFSVKASLFTTGAQIQTFYDARENTFGIPEDSGIEYFDSKPNIDKNLTYPMLLILVAPAFLMATIIYQFMYLPRKVVPKYLSELVVINKFCGFLTYNLRYNNNDYRLYEETLNSIEDSYFKRRVTELYLNSEGSKEEKTANITEEFTYTFLKNYLSVINMVLDDGFNDNYQKSLTIIQEQGDKYYKSLLDFFGAKKAALGQDTVIMIICMGMAFIVKQNMVNYFAYYSYGIMGYAVTIIYFLALILMMAVINMKYKDNKLLNKEGRYV